MTVDLRRHVRRILDGTRVGSRGGGRIFPEFISFERDRPAWWHDSFSVPAWGTVHGVHELVRGESLGAIVIAENGIALAESKRAFTWIPFENIAGWDPLTKEPLATTLNLRVRNGDSVSLPLQPGGPFAFVQFLISAIREQKIHGSGKQP